MEKSKKGKNLKKKGRKMMERFVENRKKMKKKNVANRETNGEKNAKL